MLDELLRHPAFKTIRSGILQYVNLTVETRNQAIERLIAGSPVGPDVATAISGDIAEKRRQAIVQLQSDFSGYDDPAFKEWLSTKQKETDLLAAAANVHSGTVEAYSKANQTLFGNYDSGLFTACVEQLLDEADQQLKDAGMAAELRGILGVLPPTSGLKIPDKQTFEVYKSYADQYFEPIFSAFETVAIARTEDDTIDADTFEHVMNAALSASGAREHGWRVQRADGPAKASVNPGNKVVRVGNQSLRMKPGRLKGLVAHEIGMHVSRYIGKTGFDAVVPVASVESLMHEEALGILAEQLSLRRFLMMRNYRYIALGLAIGVDGTARNIDDVHAVLWRLRYLGAKKSDQARAKYFAATEAVRIFRGVAPHLPGAAFWRDKLYLEGNHALWQKLTAQELPYEKFSELLTD